MKFDVEVSDQGHFLFTPADLDEQAWPNGKPVLGEERDVIVLTLAMELEIDDDVQRVVYEFADGQKLAVTRAAEQA